MLVNVSLQKLTPKFCECFRDELRRARAVALADAEAFDEIIVVIERLGVVLTGEPLNGLGDYKGIIGQLAQHSPMACCIPSQLPKFHFSFSELFNAVLVRRNQAVHTGVAARHLTQHAVVLALMLEEAIMSDSKQKTGCQAGFTQAKHFMVANPVCAEDWHPLSFIRQNMLANSFSYLPVKMDGKWMLISDHALGIYLREGNNDKKRLVASLETVQKEIPVKLKLEQPKICKGDEPIATVITFFKEKNLPVLVVGDSDSRLVGILTAHDLL